MQVVIVVMEEGAGKNNFNIFKLFRSIKSELFMEKTTFRFYVTKIEFIFSSNH